MCLVLIVMFFYIGEFVHSNQCRPEEFSEKRLKDQELDRLSQSLKHEILKKTSDEMKRMEILEKVFVELLKKPESVNDFQVL